MCRPTGSSGRFDEEGRRLAVNKGRVRSAARGLTSFGSQELDRASRNASSVRAESCRIVRRFDEKAHSDYGGIRQFLAKLKVVAVLSSSVRADGEN
jgi:hypothetical protein